MSATYTVGAYEIGPPIEDKEMESWYVRVGIRTRNGLILHYTCFGKSQEIAMNRAKVLARIMTVLKPNTIKAS